MSSFVVIGGCSWLTGNDGMFDSTEYDYTRAEMTKELEIPESVGESNVQDHFLVPEPNDEVEGHVYGVDNDVMAPMQILTLGNKVRTNREAAETAVYVTESKIKLWNLVERYLQSEGIEVTNKDLQNASITTDWFEIVDDSFFTDEVTAWKYRYAISFSDSDRPNENVINVKLLGGQEFYDEPQVWRDIKDVDRAEAEMLNSILGFMYVDDISSSRQRVAQSALGGITVTLGNDSNGNAALITSAEYDNVWTRIPLALGLLSITIEDQDRSQGIFFVRFKDRETFISSLAFWSESAEMLDIEEGRYQLILETQGEQISITFLDDENNPWSADLLAKNFPKLSKAFRVRITD